MTLVSGLTGRVPKRYKGARRTFMFNWLASLVVYLNLA
jgi:hypothetical protein